MDDLLFMMAKTSRKNMMDGVRKDSKTSKKEQGGKQHHPKLSESTFFNSSYHLFRQQLSRPPPSKIKEEVKQLLLSCNIKISPLIIPVQQCTDRYSKRLTMANWLRMSTIIYLERSFFEQQNSKIIYIFFYFCFLTILTIEQFNQSDYRHKKISDSIKRDFQKQLQTSLLSDIICDPYKIQSGKQQTVEESSFQHIQTEENQTLNKFLMKNRQCNPLRKNFPANKLLLFIFCIAFDNNVFSADIFEFNVMEDSKSLIINLLMSATQPIIVILLTALLLGVALSSTTQTYSINFNSATATSNNQYRPVFNLGLLEAGYTLQVTITIPNYSNSYVGSLKNMNDPIGFALYFVDGSTDTKVVQSDGITPYNFPAAVNSDVTYTASYVITFPTAKNIASANCKLSFFPSNAFSFIEYVNIQVRYYNAASTSRPVPIQTLLKVTEVIRVNIWKVFYVASSSTFSFTVYPITYDAAKGSIVKAWSTKLYQLNQITSGDLTTTNEFKIRKVMKNGKEPLDTGQSVEEKAAAAGPAGTKPSFTNQEAHYSVQLASGFYAFSVIYDTTYIQTAFTGRITFQTDPYTCPYYSQFMDYNSNFQGCTGRRNPSCSSFQDLTTICTGCIAGYTLVSGVCYSSTACPSRQYFNQGVCLNVNSLCATFGPLTGACLTCTDPTNYEVVDGSCVHKTVTCGPRQWQSNYVCYPVSQLCDTFDATNGDCLSCADPTNYEVVDGSCVHKTVTCLPRQWKFGQICYPVSQLCGTFDASNGHCTSCINKLYVPNSQGLCTTIACGKDEYAVDLTCVPLPLHCLRFSFSDQACQLCIPGYILTASGSCNINTTCPARQYFHFGQCLDVSRSCNSFDPFTGQCLSCLNADQNLVNGQCVARQVICAANQWRENSKCFNVSASCGTFDPRTGKCLTCASRLFQLNSDGTCTPIIVRCAQGQYVVGLTCVNIPVECSNFDTSLRKCFGCIRGYHIEEFVCKRILCPAGQVPSEYGIFCVNVSPLCGAYDPLNGDCLSCRDTGHTVRNGKCVQLSSPLAGCREREVLGYGPCVGANVNCKAFNLITGNCDACKEGFYLDFNGHCSPRAICASNQWEVNGECLGFPENCRAVDGLGLCTACVSTDYRLQQGQCVFFKTCTGQQYLNAGGQCVDVSASCASWNPSNGQCITCKETGTVPVSGVCCPVGQVFSGSQCVESITSQNAGHTAATCIKRHPYLNFCLQCDQGYEPDYTIPFACARQ